MSEEHKNCKYRFKGKSCEDCPLNCKFKRLQEELQKYKDMETKGLEEFKDVGGCWGCGLKLQLEQDCKDIKRLREENEEWAEKYDKLKETLKSVRGYFVVLENIIPIEMLSEGSGVFGAINDAKKEINEALNDRD